MPVSVVSIRRQTGSRVVTWRGKRKGEGGRGRAGQSEWRRWQIATEENIYASEQSCWNRQKLWLVLANCYPSLQDILPVIGLYPLRFSSFNSTPTKHRCNLSTWSSYVLPLNLLYWLTRFNSHVSVLPTATALAKLNKLKQTLFRCEQLKSARIKESVALLYSYLPLFFVHFPPAFVQYYQYIMKITVTLF